MSHRRDAQGAKTYICCLVTTRLSLWLSRTDLASRRLIGFLASETVLLLHRVAVCNATDDDYQTVRHNPHHHHHHHGQPKRRSQPLTDPGMGRRGGRPSGPMDQTYGFSFI